MAKVIFDPVTEYLQLKNSFVLGDCLFLIKYIHNYILKKYFFYKIPVCIYLEQKK